MVKNIGNYKKELLIGILKSFDLIEDEKCKFYNNYTKVKIRESYIVIKHGSIELSLLNLSQIKIKPTEKGFHIRNFIAKLNVHINLTKGNKIYKENNLEAKDEK